MMERKKSIVGKLQAFFDRHSEQGQYESGFEEQMAGYILWKEE